MTGRLPGTGSTNLLDSTKLLELSARFKTLEATEPQVKQLSENIEKVIGLADQLSWNAGNFQTFGKFYVFGWHLGLPLAATVIAFALNRYA